MFFFIFILPVYNIFITYLIQPHERKENRTRIRFKQPVLPREFPFFYLYITGIRNTIFLNILYIIYFEYCLIWHCIIYYINILLNVWHWICFLNEWNPIIYFPYNIIYNISNCGNEMMINRTYIIIMLCYIVYSSVVQPNDIMIIIFIFVSWGHDIFVLSIYIAHNIR